MRRSSTSITLESGKPLHEALRAPPWQSRSSWKIGQTSHPPYLKTARSLGRSITDQPLMGQDTDIYTHIPHLNRVIYLGMFINHHKPTLPCLDPYPYHTHVESQSLQGLSSSPPYSQSCAESHLPETSPDSWSGAKPCFQMRARI